jgi:CHAT domain-containing protein
MSALVNVQFVFLIILTACLFSCAQKMSIEEAKQVAVSMQQRPFVPPPRRIDDITKILDQCRPDPERVKNLIAKAEALPPENLSKPQLAEFLYYRAMAAMNLDRVQQGLEDLRTAAQYLLEADALRTALGSRVVLRLTIAETQLNNLRTALERLDSLFEIAVSHLPVAIWAQLGDLERAAEAERKAERKMAEWRDTPQNRFYKEFFRSYMKARILEAQGRYDEALPLEKKLLDLSEKPLVKNEWPEIPVMNRNIYAGILSNQGHLIEAEIEARQALLDAVTMVGHQPTIISAQGRTLAMILSKQGRNSDAEDLLRKVICSLEAAGATAESYGIGRSRFELGEVLIRMKRWDAALHEFRLASESLGKEPSLFKVWFLWRTAFPLVLLRTGQHEKALQLLSQSYDTLKRDFGHYEYNTMEALGLLAVALYETGKSEEAFQSFTTAVPHLLERKENLTEQRRLILESYLELLYHIRGTETEKLISVVAAEESFRVADALRAGSVRYALGQSAARAALRDPQMADLVRREQDVIKQIGGLEEMLSNHLSAPPDQQYPEVVADLRKRLERLREAQRVLRKEVEQQFPKYAEFTNPMPAAASKIRGHLDPFEALISIYPSEKGSYVWVITSEKDVQFAQVPLTEDEITGIVTRLRYALAPDPKILGDLSEFPVDAAYKLYEKLLKPLEASCKDARNLIIVATGPLSQLPFSVLVTEPVKPRKDRRYLFDRYSDIPWLIRKVSITRLPTVSSLVLLRELPGRKPPQRAFAGFGDPVFNLAQLEEVPEVKGRDRHGRISVRGIRVTNKGGMDDEVFYSLRLENLNRLPDTADEIREIGRTLGADVTRDTFLGKQASERVVKRTDLSDRRVVVFASHALVPGDLDGLTQPAIALSSPTVTNEDEDGLLTMEEVLGLKLNADWVVLSACNTGAAGGQGAEAVSGLGRAFFYAGTRAILVSMWRVETTSARKLTTGVFKSQQEGSSLSRAKALQKSILQMIDNELFIDEATGKVIASYAHPLFWAPFILVGDPGK